jgi:hypothetical protein
MALETREGLLIVVLAIVEVIVFEASIQLGLVGVERAAGTLFLLIVLNGALVVGIRRLLRR